MPRWSDQWLTENERKRLQIGQQGIKARQRIQADKENRGYPKSSIPISQPNRKPGGSYESPKKIDEVRQVIERAFKKKGR
jgi:hypothetical protein